MSGADLFGPDVDALLARQLDAAGRIPSDPVRVEVPVHVAAATVWQAIARPGNLTDVHPFCASTEVVRWPGVGARDHIHYISGLHYQRDCLAWSEGAGYVLEVGPPGAKTASARWTIEATGADECRFAIEVVSYLRADLSAAKLDRYRRDVVEAAIPPYLDGVVRGVAHYSETGLPVSRNQFGAHPLYSP